MRLDERVGEALRDLERRIDADPRQGVAGLRRTRTRRRGALSGGVALLLVAVGVPVFLGLTQPDEPPSLRPAEPRLSLVGSSGQGLGVIAGPALSLPRRHLDNVRVQFTEDGSELLYVSSDHQVALWDVDRGGSRTLARCPRRDYCSAALSADGNHLVVEGAAGTRWVDLESGRSRPSPFPHDGTVSWSPDGSRVAIVAATGLYVGDVATNRERELVHFAEPADFRIRPAWSPDGTRIAFMAEKKIPGPPGTPEDFPDIAFTLKVVDLDGGDLRTVTRAGQCTCVGIPAVAWSPVTPDRVTVSVPRVGILDISIEDPTDRVRLGLESSFLGWRPPPSGGGPD